LKGAADGGPVNREGRLAPALEDMKSL